MTIKKQVVCDGCSIEIKEQDAYSVVLREPLDSGVRTDKEMRILKGVSESSDAWHFCGQECLLKHVANNLVCL